MKEKKRAEKTATPAGGSVFDGAPAAAVNKDVNIQSGIYAETLPVAGSSVGEVRRKFRDRFDIDPDAVAIVDGKQAGEDAILKAGESLLFVRHAGEKGSTVTLEGETATVKLDCADGATTKTMPIKTLLQRCGSQAFSTGDSILPEGVRSVLSRGQTTIWIYEQPPGVRQLSWSESHRGAGEYRQVRIALPYLIIVAVFQLHIGDNPHLSVLNEAFFRNAPLKSLDDELFYTALPNCLRRDKPGTLDSSSMPLSQICLAGTVDPPSSMGKGGRFRFLFGELHRSFLESGFNTDGGHMNSYLRAAVLEKIDPRIETIEEWEKNTSEDPLFVLDVKWKTTGHSIRKVANRIFRKSNGNEFVPEPVRCVNDLANIIIQG